MKKMNLLLAAVFAGLGVRAQAAGVRPEARTVKTGKSWTRVQVKLAKASYKPAARKVAEFKPFKGPTCGVRG